MKRVCVAVFACLLGCVGCASNSTAPASGADHTVYLVSHGWHAGIVLSWRAETAHAWPAGLHLGDARHVEIGWGERDFYPAAAFRLGGALKALFWRNESVLHVVAFDQPVERYFAASERVALRLSAEQYARLVAAIGASFERDKDGRAQVLGAGLYGDSRFYLSQEHYHLFRTCNVWSARIMRAAGLEFYPAGALSTTALLNQARRIEQPDASTE